MYDALVEPSLLYVSEAWVWIVNERKRVQTAEMNCLWNINGVRRMDRVRNEQV